MLNKEEQQYLWGAAVIDSDIFCCMLLKPYQRTPSAVLYDRQHYHIQELALNDACLWSAMFNKSDFLNLLRTGLHLAALVFVTVVTIHIPSVKL